ncbi:hypothetical protein SVAN01_01462 [Stagonosporopsis vannaccii]|nr:hypothetical protein SVAN01_01462 [Stagonosporopsis vannaccii]
MAPPKDLPKLISLLQTTQSLLSHFSASLTPTPTPASTSTSTSTPSRAGAQDLPTGPLAAISAATTVLKSHTTTLSLLLLTPPLTPSALMAKLGDVTSGPLAGMVAAASHEPGPGEADELGRLMRAEMRTQVQRVVGAWGDVLAVVLGMATARKAGDGARAPSEPERKDVLAKTGVLWDVCDAVVRVCEGGVVGVVVKKAQQLRAVLLDAVEEMKEWGEDVAGSDEEEEEGDGDAEGSDGGFGDEDDFFAAGNKIGKGDVELKALLDRSVKKLKMVGIMYQAVGKRRLSTFPAATSKAARTAPPAKPPADGASTIEATSKSNADATSASKPPTKGARATSSETPAQRLDALMAHLTTLPSLADDLASNFYDLDHEEAAVELEKLCNEAKSTVAIVERDWTGNEDEFTVWAGRWREALDGA